MKKFLSKYIKSIIGGLVAFIAGYLASKGVDLPPNFVTDLTNEIINILIPTIVGVSGIAFSIKETKNQEKK